MKMHNALTAGVGGLALALIMSVGAHAAVISSTFNQALTDMPVTVSFNGVGGFAFTAASTGFGPGAAVATTGSAQVTSLFGSVTDFELGASIDQAQLYTFAGYPAATAIPFSAADDFIGLSLMLNDGVHYGYAEVFGSSLVGVGFESAPDTTIATGATGTGTGITLTTSVPTPEPASIALVATGLAMLSVRRRRSQPPAA